MNPATDIPLTLKTGPNPPRAASIHPYAFIIHPLIAPLSPPPPSHSVPEPRSEPLRPAPLKSNFLSENDSLEVNTLETFRSAQPEIQFRTV